MKSLVATIAVIGLAGCGAAASMGNSNESLSEAVRTYNESVRWQRYANAATLLPAKDRSKFVDEMDHRAEEMRITDYEVVRIDARGSREARVHVKVSWYKDAEQILRTTHATQTWERRGKSWLMIDESKLRGADMPGLADRGTDHEPNPL